MIRLHCFNFLHLSLSIGTMRTIKTKKLMSSQHNVLPPATEIPFTSFDGKMPNPLIIYIVSLRAGNPKKVI